MSKDLNEMLAETLINNTANKLHEIVADKVNSIQVDLEQKIDKLENDYKNKVNKLECYISGKPLTVNLGTLQSPKNKMVHKAFDTVIKILQSCKRINKNIMLVGEAGSGKSSLCADVASALNLQFYPMSVGLQTTKSDLLGFISATGEYMTTPLRQAFENGGVLLLDEFDATHAGVVTILNSMLANDICSFPDKIVNKHKDFICFVACNTYGKGGSIDYVGRNRLDGATLDRFICIDVDYDKLLENQLTNNKEWLNIIEKMRKNISEFGLKIIISPRASMQGADLLEAGFPIEEVLDMCIYKGLNSDSKNKLVKDIDFGIFNKKNKSNNTSKKPFKAKSNQGKITIDFNYNSYTVSGISEDITIIRETDWEGTHDINISTGNTWLAGLTATDLYLNFGKNLNFSNPCNPKDIRNFITSLDLYSNQVKLDTDDTVEITVIYEDVEYKYYWG